MVLFCGSCDRYFRYSGRWFGNLWLFNCKLCCLYCVSRFIIVWLWLWDLLWICLNSNSDVVWLWLNSLLYWVWVLSGFIVVKLCRKMFSVWVFFFDRFFDVVIVLNIFCWCCYKVVFGYLRRCDIIMSLIMDVVLFCWLYWWYWYDGCWIDWIWYLNCGSYY